MAQTKSITSVGRMSSPASSTDLLCLNGGGVNRLKIGDLQTCLSADNKNPLVRLATDGVFIMFHRKSDNCAIMVKPYNWASYQTSGEIAEGVVVFEGGKHIVVAPTEAATKLTWSSADVSAGGFTTTDRLTAMADFAGRASTTAQKTHSECNTENHAVGFCNAYSRPNANGQGLTAGKYWLPSVGEMLMIYANLTKINYALSLINGATQLVTSEPYWTSTEEGSYGAWRCSLETGIVVTNAKAILSFRVRPVSAFIQ